MTRPLLCVAAVLALASCEDFTKDLDSYCKVKGCSGTGGSGGDSGNGGGSGGGSGGGTSGCGEWGATCAGEGQCCATTMVNGTAFPLACSKLNVCQIATPDCRLGNFTCSSDGQCCTGKCASGRCTVCGGDGDPCSTAHACCNGYVCGDDNQCHSSSFWGSSGPMNGLCVASGECLSGYCFLDGGTEGACASPSTSMCTAVEGTAATPACCPGLMRGGSPAFCCEPDGTWCEVSDDCCAGSCTGGRCRASTAAYGERCDYGNDCASGVPWCDPIAHVCVDRLCFNSMENAFNGCCLISGTNKDICTFLGDAGSCLLPYSTPNDAAKCCSGRFAMGQNYCEAPTFSN